MSLNNSKFIEAKQSIKQAEQFQHELMLSFLPTKVDSDYYSGNKKTSK